MVEILMNLFRSPPTIDEVKETETKRLSHLEIRRIMKRNKKRRDEKATDKLPE